MRINHNIPALKANNQLGKTNSLLDKSLERLSSGYRINKAGDDAAGLAISQKMKTQISGLDQATRNAADGISVIQTAEGALNEVHDMLQRMRELAVQSANGTNNDEDRLAIQAEVDQLNEEITRIGKTTEFNTKKLLDGNIDRKSYSSSNSVELISLSDTVGVGVYTIDVTELPRRAQVTTTSSNDLDTSGFTPPLTTAQQDLIDAATVVDGKVSSSAVGKIFVNGEEITIEEGDSADAVFEKIRNLCDKVNVTLTATNSAGEPTLFTWGQNLVFTNDDYGSSKVVEIHADGPIEKLLGLTTSQNTTDPDNVSLAWGNNAGCVIEGKDAKVKLVLNGADEESLFKATSTVSSDGTIVRISDKNGFEIKFDIGEAYRLNDIQKLSNDLLTDVTDVFNTLFDGRVEPLPAPDDLNAVFATEIGDVTTALNDFKLVPSSANKAILDSALDSLRQAVIDAEDDRKFSPNEITRAQSMYDVYNEVMNDPINGIYNTIFANTYDGTVVPAPADFNTLFASDISVFTTALGALNGAADDASAIAAINNVNIAFQNLINAVTDPSIIDDSKFSPNEITKAQSMHDTYSGALGALTSVFSGIVDGVGVDLNIVLSTQLSTFTGVLGALNGAGSGVAALAAINTAISNSPNAFDNLRAAVNGLTTNSPPGAGEIDPSDKVTALNAISVLETAVKNHAAGFITSQDSINAENALEAARLAVVNHADDWIDSATAQAALVPVKNFVDAVGELNNVSVALLSSGPMVLQIGANQYQTMDVRIPELTPKTLGVDKVNLTTSDGSQEAINQIDIAINTVSSIRSKLGAYYNRLEHSINNLEIGAENLTEALSRIGDADMAKEMATYTQRNVLAQAGTSMLAQANQRPQTILQLLQ